MTRPPLLAPFAGWLISPEWASSVIAGAYDAKTPAERRVIVESNPLSYLGVTRSRDDLLAQDDSTDDELLQLGADTLTRILATGAFQPTGRPALYVYRLTFAGHAQTGVVGALHVDGFSDGRVLTHENVRPDRAELLSHHLSKVGSTSSPIALTHRADPAVQSILAKAATAPPDVDHIMEEVHHQVWTLDENDSRAVADLLAESVVYVTDGHHRSAAALAAWMARPEDHAFHRTLAVLFPDDALRVEAFHRRSPDRDSRALDELMLALATVGSIETVADHEQARPQGRGQVGVYSHGCWFRLTLDPIERPGALAQLDVERLRRDVIGHVLGVDELEENSGVDYVPAPTGIEEVIRRCDADGSVGFIVHPTSVEDLMAVADANELMPPKSSYVAPKPRSGIFLRILGIGATGHLPPS